MNYTSLSFNGAWQMIYCDSPYCKKENPWNCRELMLEKNSVMIADAVPGYWEDMVEKFMSAPFFTHLKVNPSYGLWQYPISGVAPDMALPNIYGNFFYKRHFECEGIIKDAVLHFDGVQNSVSVWVNDSYIGFHRGYSTPFDISIPDGLLRDGENIYAENEWELYLFPKVTSSSGDVLVSDGMTEDELISSLKDGKNVLILGAKPFVSLPASFRIALAGRCSGNLATVINDHPVLDSIPHEGFCGWQFASMLDSSETVCFESDDVPFNPIIEVVSTHKYVIKKSALFEFSAFNGKCVVCSLSFKEGDPMADYLKACLLKYMTGDKFSPAVYYSEEQLKKLIGTKVTKAAENNNFAFNPNDKTAVRKKPFKV